MVATRIVPLVALFRIAAALLVIIFCMFHAAAPGQAQGSFNGKLPRDMLQAPPPVKGKPPTPPRLRPPETMSCQSIHEELKAALESYYMLLKVSAAAALKAAAQLEDGPDKTKARAAAEAERNLANVGLQQVNPDGRDSERQERHDQRVKDDATFGNREPLTKKIDALIAQLKDCEKRFFSPNISLPALPMCFQTQEAKDSFRDNLKELDQEWSDKMDEIYRDAGSPQRMTPAVAQFNDYLQAEANQQAVRRHLVMSWYLPVCPHRSAAKSGRTKKSAVKDGAKNNAIGFVPGVQLNIGIGGGKSRERHPEHERHKHYRRQ
jgi:hypothetical protein